MDRFAISTAGIPEHERFAFWQDVCCAPLGLRAEVTSTQDRPFEGSVSYRLSGPLLHMHADADGFRVVRGKVEIGRRSWGGYSLYREAGKGMLFRHEGNEIVTRPGDIFLAEADVPFTGEGLHGQQLDSIVLPRELLEPHLPKRGRSPAMSLQAGSAAASLVSNYLTALLHEWDKVPPAMMAQLADNLSRLVAITRGAPIGEHTGALSSARLSAAKRYIRTHLADPSLSPEVVAAALGVSVRSLHLSFEPTAISFASHVRMLRLHECRAALLAEPTRPVIDIAFAWGFNSLPTFYRLFRAAFGCAPGDLREMRTGSFTD